MENESKNESKEITPDQAVDICKWLEMQLYYVDGPENSPMVSKADGGLITPMDYLEEPEGEVAMMDKLQDYYFIRIRKVVETRNDFKDAIHIGLASLDLKIKNQEAIAPTRNAALQLAILKMLEGK